MATLMIERETWAEYVGRVLGDMRGQDAAAAAGISPSTMSRWMNQGGPKAPAAEHVVAFAGAFGQSPVKALIAAGYLETSDVDNAAIEIMQSRSELSDGELIDELAVRLARRVKRGHADTVTDRLTLGDDPGDH